MSIHRPTKPQRERAEFIPACREHHTVGRRVQVLGKGSNNVIGTVFSFVEASEDKPVPRRIKRSRYEEAELSPLTKSFYCVVDDQGRSHYAEEVFFL
ncbi:hypothetical protein [Bradyrhizobium sp. Tv2a-2]|uniref:hypothetical protein n=1 Tax=Bradyrhizobium sp. Tv2a-2 TaxID=113395 RepID=UPI00041D363B|nr:hypothetical protein [Bradyrhizobium sp. Tv2a-2]